MTGGDHNLLPTLSYSPILCLIYMCVPAIIVKIVLLGIFVVPFAKLGVRHSQGKMNEFKVSGVVCSVFNVIYPLSLLYVM